MFDIDVQQGVYGPVFDEDGILVHEDSAEDLGSRSATTSDSVLLTE